jgi:hypothetical protein
VTGKPIAGWGQVVLGGIVVQLGQRLKRQLNCFTTTAYGAVEGWWELDRSNNWREVGFVIWDLGWLDQMLLFLLFFFLALAGGT